MSLATISKRFRSTLTIVALCLVATSAQPAGAQRFGLTFGKTKSDIVNTYNGQGSSSYPDRESFTAGVTYRHRLWAGTVVQPELLIVPRGWSERNHPTLSLTYIELPVLLRFGALSATGWPARPVFTIGPSVSLLAHCSLTNLDLARAEGSGCRQRIVAGFVEDYTIQRFDVGATLGLGFEIRRSGTVFGIEGRYELGLVDIRPGRPETSRNSTFFMLLNVVPRTN